MIKERKDFYALAKMKSECKKNNKMFWYKTNNKTNIIVDLSELDNTWINDKTSQIIKEDLIKEICQSAISDTVFAIPVPDYENGRVMLIDMDFARKNVYDSAGKRLYVYKQLVGYAIRFYKMNIYGNISDWDMPYSSILYGTKNGLTFNRIIEDVEI